MTNHIVGNTPVIMLKIGDDSLSALKRNKVSESILRIYPEKLFKIALGLKRRGNSELVDLRLGNAISHAISKGKPRLRAIWMLRSGFCHIISESKLNKVFLDV